MEATIWKFPLKIVDEQEIETPELWNPLSLQVQKVAPDTQKVRRKIKCFGTGHPIPAPLTKYLGTCQTGPFVWHYYEDAE